MCHFLNYSNIIALRKHRATFYEVYKKKTTQGIKSLHYVLGLFTSVLWLYYALIKGDAMYLTTISSVGIAIQTFYLCVFAFYAPKRAMMKSLKQIMMFIVIGFGLIVILSQLLTKGTQRDVIVGWVVLVLTSLCVFVTPSSVLTQVIKTKSVKYMPILLVLSVTLSGFVWFFYGLLLADLNIMVLLFMSMLNYKMFTY
ncbi:putative SWEET sugar transporter [Helianthus annuus]|uniref:SWEET sugar transporter n=1 Tax=Helianthus annuus TaxID=4232 RepID=A0A251UWJ7_HELAN|nr:putative SWEET sugar transporter [Helianthus annuus]KAJ0579706.1 putative SWEET sugar transporter [Helianthus annuus]KAJ0586996.1 putative SWEET sugar transporter [Helianthus annuus]KAJ0595603.1 putative SWEET sugar transporter [Helianthus annuus]KAJ0756254.1 putative SWEET sugar transporter [Helianthus annuus]